MHLLQLHFIREQKTAVVHNRLQALLLDATNKNIARGKTAQNITSMTILTSLASIDGIFTISKGHPYIYFFSPFSSIFVQLHQNPFSICSSTFIHFFPIFKYFYPRSSTYIQCHSFLSVFIHFDPYSSISSISSTLILHDLLYHNNALT